MNEGNGNGEDPPGYVTMDLCRAYRETLEEKITGIRNQIVGALAISTAVISLIMYLLNVRF
jgi:hypothetical protein